VAAAGKKVEFVALVVVVVVEGEAVTIMDIVGMAMAMDISRPRGRDRFGECKARVNGGSRDDGMCVADAGKLEIIHHRMRTRRRRWAASKGMRG
jgi:hypothetical protein